MNPRPEGEGIIALRAHPKIRRGEIRTVVPPLDAEFSRRVFSRIIVRASRVSTSNRQTEALTRNTRRYKNFESIPKYLFVQVFRAIVAFYKNTHDWLGKIETRM